MINQNNDKSTPAFTLEDVRGVVTEVIRAELTRCGFDTEKPLELQRDLGHLRQLRQSHEVLTARGLIAALSLIIGIILASAFTGIVALFKLFSG